MKKYLLLTISILFLSYGCNSALVDAAINYQDYEKGEITKKQSGLIFDNTKVFPNETQISIAFIKNGIPKYYGVKRMNDTIISIENYKNVFEIGSITKVFTATLLAGLVLENRMELEDNINQYLKFSFKNNQQIKFKELANHTSGLPGMPTNFNFDVADPNPFEKYDGKKLEEYMSYELELSDKEYEYSNLGAALLAYTLSEITNSSYKTLLQEKIFSKYGMTKSTIGAQEVKPFLIKGLSPEGETVQNWDLAALAGAGAIISSVEDLTKFVLAQFENENEELKLTRAKTLKINSKTNVGLGWHIKKKYGNNWFWHNGGTGGYSSSIAFNTVSRNSVVILSNVSSFNENTNHIDKICFELMRTLEDN